jgi:hypothetical protein
VSFRFSNMNNPAVDLNLGLMYSTIDSETASQTPRECHHKRAG